MSNPPDKALPCARSVIADAYKRMDRGITYRAVIKEPRRVVKNGHLDMSMAEGAPSVLESAADASTAFPRLLMGMHMTHAGAEVLHKTKKIGCKVNVTAKDIFEAELLATIVIAQETIYARHYLKAMGEEFDAPTRILTDSLSGALVLNSAKSVGRSRPFLWRCAVVQELAQQGIIEIVHVDDEENPADYMTKWLAQAKVQKSARYSRGEAHG